MPDLIAALHGLGIGIALGIVIDRFLLGRVILWHALRSRHDRRP